MSILQFPGCVPWPLCQGYGHGERVFDVAFHPLNDDVVLTASEDTSVRMWRRTEGATMYKQARAFLGHAGEVLRVAWAGNGLLLASGSADRTVRLWAADLYDQGYTGRQLAVLDGHPEEVYHVEFVDPTSPPPPPTAAVRRPHSAAAAAGGGEEDPGGAAAAPHGGGAMPPFESHVLSASCESLFVWSLQEGALLQQADAPGTSGSSVTQADIAAGARPAYIFGVSRQPGGSLVAAACCDGCVRLWSLRPTGQLEWAGGVALPGQPMCVGCAFAADGARLGVVTRQGALVELDVRTLELLTSRPLPSSPLTIAYMPGAPRRAFGAAGGGGGGGGSAEGRGGGEAAPEVWLVACRDGAVYGYALEGKGAGHACEVRPPAAPGTAVLAVAVAAGGRALALAGEPQDASLLPPMRQQPAATAAKSNGATPHVGQAAPHANGSAAAAAAASGSGASAAAAPTPVAARPAVAAAAAAAAPRRRRGAGSGRVVAGGLTSQDPLALFDEQDGGRAQAAPRVEGDPVAGSLAAMSLGETPSGGGAQPQQRAREQAQARAQAGPASAGAAAAARDGERAVGGGDAPGKPSAGEAQAGASPTLAAAAGGVAGQAAPAGAGTQQGGEQEEGRAVRVRAALFVYRADLA